jgi:hypothetical protein
MTIAGQTVPTERVERFRDPARLAALGRRRGHTLQGRRLDLEVPNVIGVGAQGELGRGRPSARRETDRNGGHCQNGISSSGLPKFLPPEDALPRLAPPLPLDGDGAEPA